MTVQPESEHPDLMLSRARALSHQAHADQKRDDGKPYATHPDAVVGILRRYGVTDVETLAAAYLHDVLEDTDVNEDELRTAFGEGICELVLELTNPATPGRTFEQKHAALLAHARAMSDRAKRIKLADRLHNLSEMGVWTRERCQRYAQATHTLLDALSPWPNKPLAQAVQELANRHAAGS